MNRNRVNRNRMNRMGETKWRGEMRGKVEGQVGEVVTGTANVGTWAMASAATLWHSTANRALFRRSTTRRLLGNAPPYTRGSGLGTLAAQQAGTPALPRIRRPVGANSGAVQARVQAPATYEHLRTHAAQIRRGVIARPCSATGPPQRLSSPALAYLRSPRSAGRGHSAA